MIYYSVGQMLRVFEYRAIHYGSYNSKRLPFIVEYGNELYENIGIFHEKRNTDWKTIADG